MILCSMLLLSIAFGRCRFSAFFALPAGFACGALVLVCLPVVLAFPCILIGLLGSFAPVRGGTYFLCRRRQKPFTPH
jgi:hypothetical protein